MRQASGRLRRIVAVNDAADAIHADCMSSVAPLKGARTGPLMVAPWSTGTYRDAQILGLRDGVAMVGGPLGGCEEQAGR